MPKSSVSREPGHSPEIAELERLVAAKREALEREGKSLPEREVFREVFRERYGEALGSRVPAPAPPPAEPAAGGQKPVSVSLGQSTHEAELEELVALAFTKGVAVAADAARQTSPWLMDELHDRLVDRYYAELIQAKRMRPL